MKQFLHNERRLLVAVVLLLILSNVPYGRQILYPFTLFSTWVHELFHGLAALVQGERIASLEIFRDGSGKAMTTPAGDRLGRSIVSSAGYVGTAAFGAGLLALRRWPRAGRIGVVAIGAVMLLSVALWVRNGFGIFALGASGAALVAAGLKLTEEWSGHLYAFLAVTCSLNAFTSIKILFSGATLQVAGKPVDHSDAHSVAEQLFLPYWFWAGLWLVLSVALMVLALKVGAAKEARERSGT